MPEFHSTSQQLLSFLFGWWTGHSVGTIVPKNKDLRFSFRDHELSGYSAVPVIPKRHIR